jgi:hypothetical protein
MNRPGIAVVLKVVASCAGLRGKPVRCGPVPFPLRSSLGMLACEEFHSLG